MITTPTVFVLGAGASVPYGYPTGAGLRSEVLEGISGWRGDAAVWAQGKGLEAEAKRFAVALTRSRNTSVDAFLEHRRELQAIGKLAMASVLLRCENDERLFSEREIQGDWLTYLLNAMSEPFDAFSGNKVSFITFNYDRVLEHALFNAVQHRYDKSVADGAHVLRTIGIVHVHGSLGPLPWQEPDGHPYGRSVQLEDVLSAADRIKIVYEGAEEDPEFKVARTLIRKASRIYFLGFGYSKDNVERLHLWECGEGAWIYGTALGFTDRERGDAEKLLKDQNDPPKSLTLRVVLKDLDCYEFLRNDPVRLD